MAKIVTIAIDAMGGDQAPGMIIQGMELARVLHPKNRYLIFGDEKSVSALLARQKQLLPLCEIHHTDELVGSEDRPSQALRRGRNSSMGLAIQSVKDGKADVAVSAGNTGALMALAKFILRTIPGIDRPALISPIPTLRGESVMLDLGANVECDAQNLVQFSVMGAAYVRTVLGQSRPRVGLLNVGVEELKGKDSIQHAAAVLRASSHLGLEFAGFVEGNDIPSGDVDVVVTDGFTGNIALKTMEGTATLLTSLLGRAFRSSVATRLGYILSRAGLRSLRDHLDPNSHNGGVFIGLNGLVVKSHGGANAAGFATAISTAVDMAENNLNQLITDDLQQIVEADTAEDN